MIVWVGLLIVSEWVIDQKLVGYGQLKQWKYVESFLSGGINQCFVYFDCVFIFGDYFNDVIGFFESGYNVCVSFEKVEGGFGELFLKNVVWQFNVNFEKEIDFNNFVLFYGVSMDELQDKFNEVVGEMNCGNDVLMII